MTGGVVVGGGELEGEAEEEEDEEEGEEIVLDCVMNMSWYISSMLGELMALTAGVAVLSRRLSSSGRIAPVMSQ